eukprot:Skav231881  [mRNA]  locus=scaffold54:296676:305340:- [translate_table: standard]
MWINDDLDDIKYEFDRLFYHFARKEQEKKTKVVVLGSGWGALSFVRKLDPSAFDVTVVSPRPFFFYTPLLVGSTTGVVSPGTSAAAVSAIIEPIRDNVPNCDFLRVHCKDSSACGERRLGRSSVTDHLWWRSLYGDNDRLGGVRTPCWSSNDS